MPLVHVIARKIFVPKRAQYAHAADSQQNFLAQPVIRIAAIKSAGEVAVPFRVGRKIGVEKINRHYKAAYAFNVIAPAAQFDAPVFQRHGYARRFFLEKIFDVPHHGLFRLGAIFGEMLRKESSAVEERHGHHR